MSCVDMNQDELKAVFDKQAAGYERQQEKLAPVHDGLYFQLKWIAMELPETARVLCVGLGTGMELSYLAANFPGWQFTAVEPSGAMLEVCRQRAEREGYSFRCVFHEGYLESLPDMELHDAATCFMVSHFILDNEARSGFFRTISERLKPNGLLISADLSSAVGSPEYKALLAVWVNMLHGGKAPDGAMERIHSSWAKDVAILPPAQVESILEQGGFDSPVRFYQAGLVHAWFSRRSGNAAA